MARAGRSEGGGACGVVVTGLPAQADISYHRGSGIHRVGITLAGVIAALLLTAPAANAACRQALALGLDISGSVDTREYDLQRQGLAQALGTDDVARAILQQSSAPIRLTVFEWSGPTAQTVILPWTTIANADDLTAARQRIRAAPRSIQDQTTALGSALLTGFAMLDTQADCWTRTLDLSGDGIANTGPRPQDIPASRTPQGVTVNGLTIAPNQQPGQDDSIADITELSAYFRAYVIRGPGAFVETALGFDNYAAAMERKLLRELQSLALSDARQ